MKILMLYNVDCDGIGDYMITTIDYKTNLKELFYKNKDYIIDKIMEEGNICIQIFSPDNMNDFLTIEFFSISKKRLFKRCFTFEDIREFL